MQDKHKVTLYLPPELHRQLKVRSAVDLEPMSTIAERALVFYLQHPDVIDEVEASHGQVHRIYSCPSCAASLVMREGEVLPIQEHPVILSDDEPVARVQVGCSDSDQPDQGELVPCSL
ncbi:MAG: hypothetical protein MUF72_07565 [Elainella sp. Prado103]|nr:hypothetical protein [Elainella sp. Prado103]